MPLDTDAQLSRLTAVSTALKKAAEDLEKLVNEMRKKLEEKKILIKPEVIKEE